MTDDLKTFYIRGALGGGFGGVMSQEWEKVRFENLEQANAEAEELAWAQWHMYEGTCGLPTLEEIMEQEQCSQEDAEMYYREEAESWLEWEAVEDEPEEYEEY